MATVYRCDGCGDEFTRPDDLQEIAIVRGEFGGESHSERRTADVCHDCEPLDLVDQLQEAAEDLLDRRANA